VKKAVPAAKGKALFMPLRLALTGREDGPELRAVFELMPPAERLRRLEAAEERLRG
ncbi:MAG: glutamate--tRNA ligase, partial [Candidatus Methylomirabilis sp.]|nr:glutamate--tRNA ligase [Deltaproteobacteria bacterium]